MRKAWWLVLVGICCLALAAYAGPPANPVQRQTHAVPTVVLPSAEQAAPEKLAALREQNLTGGGVLVAAGFERDLPEPLTVDFQAEPIPGDLPALYQGGLLSRADDGTLSWSVQIEASGSYSFGVHLERVTLPEGCRVSVFAPGLEAPKPCALSSCGPDAEIRSPSVSGPYARLRVEFPPSMAPSGGFKIAGISQVFPVEKVGFPGRPGPIPGPSGEQSAPQPFAIAPPSNLTATVTGLNTVLLQWQDNSTNETGFKVQRRLGTSGKYGLLIKLGPGSTTYTDGTVISCQQYSYRVKAMKGTNASAPSNEAVVTAGTPGNLTLTATAECIGNNPQNRLMWTASVAASSYDVYRNGTLLASGQTGPLYLDTTVTGGQNYLYRITARNTCGSKDSNDSSATALSNCCPLPGATVVTATANCTAGTPQILVSWTASTNTTFYDVLRNGVSYAPGQTGLSYTDSSVTASTSYNYSVVPKSVCGQGTSNTASATAGNPPGAFTLTVTPDCYGSPGVPALKITWTAASGVTNSSSYDIYRDGASAPLQSNVSQLIIWYDISVAAGSTHSYFVRAKNTCGHTDSNTASSTAPASCTFSVIVDDLDSGFHMYGPPAWWFPINDPLCYAGHMWYTPNETIPPSANYAYWFPSLAGGGAGTYAIYVYIPCVVGATTTSATYYEWHGATLMDSHTVNQLIYCSQWVPFGNVYCWADGTDVVGLGDATGEPILSTNVGYDAIRWEKQP